MKLALIITFCDCRENCLLLKTGFKIYELTTRMSFFANFADTLRSLLEIFLSHAKNAKGKHAESAENTN